MFFPSTFSAKQAALYILRPRGGWLLLYVVIDYVVIDNEAIKKADVTAEPLPDNQSTTPTASAGISIAKVLAKINSPDVFKYVPVAGDTPLSVLALLLRVW